MEAKATRNAQGGGTIRKRVDGRWEARYTIGIDPGTGKRIQKSVYGHTQKEARQRLSKATTELDEGAYFEPTRRISQRATALVPGRCCNAPIPLKRRS